MFKKFVFCGALILAASVFATSFAEEEGFVSLFNGKDLSGWTIKGGYATYKVEDGAIVGTCTPDTPNNTFLCTEKEYGDFILKLDFKFLVDGNSGVQIRSHSRPWKEDRESVFGYQCELANYDATGRIYDEGRRGHRHGTIFLDKTSDDVRREAWGTFKKGEWNSIEIQCVGPSIRTWLNGKPVANILDPVEFSGFIGLQVHAGKQGTIAWKNIRIKELGKTEWKPFFVKTDDGWKLDGAHFVLDGWTFNDAGELRGVHVREEKRDGLVVSDNDYSDFAVRVSYKFFGGNSALYFRAQEVPTPWLLKGFQNEIAGNNLDSALWHTAGDKTPGRGWVVRNEELVAKVKKPNDQWNSICTIACGDRLVQFLNDFPTSDIVDPLCEKSGKFGLQLHGSADAEMWFKNFEYVEITPEMRKLIER
ncbi:MAG: DUF1080 domain-containing protein [Planctomycetia bacterium]|nr:DUF1080 domain-containing protein [Planctomycetia bacterium]